MQLSLSAQPEPILFDLRSTAVIVIDMPNHFGSPGGMLDRAGMDTSSIQHIVAPITAVLEAARAAGMPVIYARRRQIPISLTLAMTPRRIASNAGACRWVWPSRRRMAAKAGSLCGIPGMRHYR